MVLTVLSSFLRQSCLVFTNVTSALEVCLNVMRYINPRFTYLLTYLKFSRHYKMIFSSFSALGLAYCTLHINLRLTYWRQLRNRHDALLESKLFSMILLYNDLLREVN